VLATFLMGFRNVQMHYANRGPAPLRPFPPEMAEFADWIRAEVPAEARLAFAGRTVHFYGGGNLAYLPVLTGREMMADDYYGFPRGTIEFDYPPRYYRKNTQRFVFFSHAYGISHWVVADPFVMDILDAHPAEFEQVKTMKMIGREFGIYRVAGEEAPTRFWEGAGRVAAHQNRLEVWPADPAAERVVIRYNWRKGLICRTPGAAIEPFAVDKNLKFIAVRPGGNAHVEIGYRPHWAPVESNFDGYFHH
jgi:hypothetical protein